MAGLREARWEWKNNYPETFRIAWSLSAVLCSGMGVSGGTDGSREVQTLRRLTLPS